MARREPAHIRRKPVTDVLHGIRMTDPYRWLEDSEAPDTRAFDEVENRLTRASLDGPEHARWKEAWLRWARVPSYREPRCVGPYLYFLAYEDERPQPRLFRAPRSAGARTLVVDPLGEGPDGLSALDWWAPSPSGRYVAYGISRAGDEKSTLFVYDTETRAKLAEAIPGARYA